MPIGFTIGLVGNGDALPRREPPALPGGRNGDEGRRTGDDARMRGFNGRRVGLVARGLNTTPALPYGEFALPGDLGDGARAGPLGDNNLTPASGGVGGKPVVGGGVGGGLLGSFALLGGSSSTLIGGGATNWIPPRLVAGVIGCLEEVSALKAC